MKRYLFYVFTSLLMVFALLSFVEASAKPSGQQTITTPDQLIAVVNALRASNGLGTLTVHPILMQTAQSQADYMSSTGQVTHSRPGSSYTQQLLSLGFPLAGDLSRGGFRAENILSSYNPLVWDGVPPAWQDPDHMNTMLSPNFTHIGAGISQGAGGYYYAVDCAATTTSGQMQGNSSTILTAVPSGINSGINEFIVPVTISTPKADGTVVHIVENGQSLWSIAIAYGTTIKSIQELNFLGADPVVYTGQELIVLVGVTPPAPPTSTLAPPPTLTPTAQIAPVTEVSETPATIVLTDTPQPEQTMQIESNAPSSSILVVVLIVGALIGGGVAVWLIRDPE